MANRIPKQGLLLFAAWLPIDGVWLQPCDSGALRLEVISNGRAALTEANYSDARCGHPRISITSSGSVSISANVSSPDSPSTRNIDFVFESIQMTLLDSETVDFYNAGVICGFSDWQKNEPKTITGLQCDLFQTGNLVLVPSAGDARYGIFSLTSTEAGEILYFGQLTPERDGRAPERRPIEIDPRGYVRQNPATPDL